MGTGADSKLGAMSGWMIRIPYRNPADDLVEVAIEAENLPEEERRVVQEIVLQAQVAGDHQARDLLERLGAMDAKARRGLLDKAREACGYERSVDIDDAEAFRTIQEMARRSASGRDRDGRALMQCAAEGCTAHPMDSNGMLARVPDRRWWCDAHRDQT